MNTGHDITPTWTDREDMQRGMSLMLQGNPYFAWQFIKGDMAPYNPCYELRQLEEFREAIFDGTKTAGFYSIRRDGMTRWGAIDFDDHEARGVGWHTKAEAAYKTLSHTFEETWFLETHPGGFHVIAFAPNPFPAVKMRRALQACAPEGVEVFPKQDELGKQLNAKGSLLRFPGKHQLKGHWARFIDRSGRIKAPEKEVGAAKQHEWQPPSQQRRFLSLYTVATQGIALINTGQRFEAMKKIVGRLKGRVNEEEAREVYIRWHNLNQTKITTPFDKSLIEFLTWFRKADPGNNEIPDCPLTTKDEALIERLTSEPGAPVEALKKVARFLLQAKKHADTKGLPEFWLSLPMIADKLGVSVATACRYRSACVNQGFVELVERGYTGRASTFHLRS